MKCDIEVIDRLKVDDDFKLRISQSVQQTLKIGKDLMFGRRNCQRIPNQKLQASYSNT
jgi:hypothetical protein